MATENKEAESRYKTHTQREVQYDPLVADRNVDLPKGQGDPGIKFSIVFPTRERPDLLKSLLESINKNTFNLNEIEVLIAVDDDDITNYGFVELSFPFATIYRVKRSLNFSRDYYTFLAKQSTGRWIITANDDCVFETPEWDTLAYNVLKDKPGVIYGWIQDHLATYRANGHGNYCCFPLQGRAGFEALGYIFPSRVPTWGADIWAKNLYDQVNSVVELPITLRHYCHHNKTRGQDHISKRIANSQVPFDMRPGYDEINKLLAALKREMAKA